MTTPNGEIVIIETKLWNNPEARRKVIAQILDYAKEIALWTYEDLQREINKKLKRKGNTLYEIACEQYSDFVPTESDFVDSVNRNLSRGKFLLLIVGDGIREGAKRIKEFLSNSGHLSFTLAMIELNLYQSEEIGTLVIPKTIVKTIEIPKISVELPLGMRITYKDETQNRPSVGLSISPDKEQERNFYIGFWEELVNEIVFDDPGQPLPIPGKGTNLFVYPSDSKKVWISAYFMKSKQEIGVYFKTKNDIEGREILAHINENITDILKELNENNEDQTKDLNFYSIRKKNNNLFEEHNRNDIKEFFKTTLNRYINVFRPYLISFES